MLSALRAALSSSSLLSIGALSSALTLSPNSPRAFSHWNTRFSPLFFASTSSRRFLSSSANCSASLTALSMSSFDMFVEAVIEMFCSLPVPRSFAETCTIPFWSISNVTSICGIPLGAGAIPSRRNIPSCLLSFANSRSPWRMLMSTALWLSAAVEKICDFFVGIVVFLSMIFVHTPPIVSRPSESGVTSRRRRPSLTSPPSTPPW